jgi:hypothetical protein
MTGISTVTHPGVLASFIKALEGTIMAVANPGPYEATTLATASATKDSKLVIVLQGTVAFASVSRGSLKVTVEKAAGGEIGSIILASRDDASALSHEYFTDFVIPINTTLAAETLKIIVAAGVAADAVDTTDLIFHISVVD